MGTEPKGTLLKDIDEELSLKGGTPVTVLQNEKPTRLTRKLAISQALESYTEAKKADKFTAFDLGMRFQSANGEVSISDKESVLIQAALESQWPQPGIYVPLCRWLEGE